MKWVNQKVVLARYDCRRYFEEQKAILSYPILGYRFDRIWWRQAVPAVGKAVERDTQEGVFGHPKRNHLVLIRNVGYGAVYQHFERR